MFTAEELAYIESQRLARIATVAPDGQPDVTPVGFELTDGAFYVGGFDAATTRKVRNIRAGNARVALVVDDIASFKPWVARGVRIYGTAEIVERVGWLGPEHTTYIKIVPHISWSWGLVEKTDGRRQPHKTIHDQPQPAN